MQAIYKTVLETYVYAQQSNILNNVQVTLAGQTKIVNIKVPCAYIIGDMQGGDKLCNCTANYSNKIKRVSCKCDVPGPELDNVDYKCKLIDMNKVIQHYKNNDVVMLEELKQINAWSAWFDVDYGGCKYGIFSAAMPVEPLHALENGIIMYCLQTMFVVQILEAQCEYLDS